MKFLDVESTVVEITNINVNVDRELPKNLPQNNRKKPRKIYINCILYSYHHFLYEKIKEMTQERLFHTFWN